MDLHQFSVARIKSWVVFVFMEIILNELTLYLGPVMHIEPISPQAAQPGHFKSFRSISKVFYKIPHKFREGKWKKAHLPVEV